MNHPITAASETRKCLGINEAGVRDLSTDDDTKLKTMPGRMSQVHA